MRPVRHDCAVRHDLAAASRQQSGDQLFVVAAAALAVELVAELADAVHVAVADAAVVAALAVAEFASRADLNEFWTASVIDHASAVGLAVAGPAVAAALPALPADARESAAVSEHVLAAPADPDADLAHRAVERVAVVAALAVGPVAAGHVVAVAESDDAVAGLVPECARTVLPNRPPH